MYITAKIHPIDLLTDLMSRRSYAEDDTAQFNKVKHNSDLCPRFTEHAKRVISDYEKHRSNIHDIQGLSDLGVDVMVSFKTDDGEKRVGLQIKSYHDFKTWWGVKGATGFMEKLQSQYAQARNRGRVDLWYLMLCTDEVEHRDALRHVRSEFTHYKDVKIIDPIEALSFYKMTEMDIDVAVSRRLSSDDYVRVKAEECLLGYPEPIRKLVIELTCRALDGEVHISDDEAFALLADVDENADAADTLSALEDLLNPDGDVGGYSINVDHVPALAATYFDQRVRFGAARSEMGERLSKLLL